MSNCELFYRDEIEYMLESMIQDDYVYDEDYRKQLADYTEEDLRDLTDELINDSWLSEQINNTIEFAINKRFGGDINDKN